MTKPHSAQFLVSPGDLGEGTVLLDLEESRHARDARRVRVGETVNLTDGFGHAGNGVVVEVPRRGQVKLEVKDVRAVAKSVPQVTVVQALARGERLEGSVAMMTELGVAKFVPWRAERSAAGGGDVAMKWQKVAREACKQSGRAWLPEISPEMDLPQFSLTLPQDGPVIVGDVGASETLGTVNLESPHSVTIVIGPEGGITDTERNQLKQVGAHFVSLGPHTLRAATAGVALVAGVLALVPAESLIFGGSR